MKLRCSREDLHQALSFTLLAASTRTALPILQTVQLKAENSMLKMQGCDGEMWAGRSILARVDEAGGICASAKLLTDLIAALPKGDLLLELKDSRLHLHQGPADWKVLALPVEDFPEPPRVDTTALLKLPIGELRAAIDKVAYAASDDFSRPILTGVLFTYDGGELTLVATDTHRLAVLRLSKEGIGSEISAVVPGKALKALKHLPLEDEEVVSLCFDEARMMVEAGECSLIVQLLAGTYPNWQSVVPAETTKTWTFDRMEFLDHTKRAMILARDNANRIRFHGTDGQILIAARSEEKGEAKEELAAVCKNGDLEIAFNGKYVLDALGSFQSEGIRGEFSESTRPAIFRSTEESESNFCVIMPMALG